MNLIRYLLVVVLAMFLSACGGGGGSAGNPGGVAPAVPVVPPLLTTAPLSLITSVGAAQEFSITGGSSPYSVVSNDAAVVTAGVNGSKLTIGGIASGDALVLIRDAVGAAISVTVTVRGALPLFTNAPASLTTSVGAAQEFSITGGSSPYSVVSNDAAVVTAGVNGSKLTICGIASGTATVLIRDAVGAAVSVNVTVRGAALRELFTTAASSVVVSVGLASAQTYNVGGGTAPYTATSSNASVAAAVLTGNNLTVIGLVAGSANIVIRDNVGASTTVAVTVQPVSNLALFTTAPASVTVIAGAAPIYAVGGGTGPYTATSSNANVATVSLLGGTLTITSAAAGSANIVIRDSVGASTTVAVAVQPLSNLALFTTAPASVTVIAGAAPTYSVGGGTGPYTAASSNTNVATVSLLGGTLTITSTAAGSANIVIRDSVGASTTVAVTVQPLSNLALFTTAPTSLTVAIGNSPAYTVGGGSGSGYVAISSNVGVVTVNLVGTNLTVTGVAVGSASVVMRDSAGATVTFNVVVGAIPLAITPGGATGIINDILIATITGGTPPYRASVGNVLVATAVIQNSNELRVTLLQVGQTIATVLDANNQSVAFTLTSNAATPSIRLSPGAVTISEFDIKQPIVFTVFGAAAGKVDVFSSDVTLLSATIASDNRTVTITKNRCVAADLPVTITVIDSTRAVGVAIVTVKDNDSGVTGTSSLCTTTSP